MSGVRVRPATADELSRWDDIVVRFENYRLFHKRSWIRSLETCSGAKALYLVFERNGEILGCLPGFLVCIAFLRLFASPLEGWQTPSMGPVFDKTKTGALELFSTAVPFLEKEFGVAHIEVVSAELDHEAMRSVGFTKQSLFTYRVPLFPGDEERTLKNVDAKTRNQLRKAKKLGLSARMEDGEAFVGEFYDQLKEVFARNKKSVPFRLERAVQCFRYMKESGNLVAISINMPGTGICIATGMFLIEGRESRTKGDYRSDDLVSEDEAEVQILRARKFIEFATKGLGR